MKLYIPISTDSNDSVKRSYAVCMMTELAGFDVCIEEMGDSHADRACNKMANAFLKTDCGAMLIIDCDIIFRRKDVEKMIGHLERGVKAVWGIYPKKHEETDPCLCTFETKPEPDEHGLAAVRRSGRGFLMVHRSVFEALKEDNGGPAVRYHNHGELQWCFFRSGAVTERLSALQGKDPDGYPVREWISEDWMLCEDLRNFLRIPTLVDTTIALGHVGSKIFRFGGNQLVRMDSNIKSWRDIHGWFDYEDLYRDLVAKIPDGGTFIEVGSWLGKSLCAFDAFAKERGKSISLHAVDTFKGEPANAIHEEILKVHGGSVETAFRENMKALGVCATVHAEPSIKAAWELFRGSLWADAVFIDADHSEEAVCADIKFWLPIVKPGGILAGHDYDEEGVRRAVDKMLPTKDSVKAQGRCWVFQKA